MRKIEDQIRRLFSEYQPGLLGQYQHFSVVIPLIEREQTWHLLYEVRSDQISQPGDTAFPGGKVELGETYQSAAIRECMEELNLRFDQIEVIGQLDDLIMDQMILHSFVALIKDIRYEEIQADSLEVSYLFTIPLNYLLSHTPHYYEVKTEIHFEPDFPFHLLAHGREYQFRVGKRMIPFYNLKDGYYLWGITANLTHHFTQLLTLNRIESEEE